MAHKLSLSMLTQWARPGIILGTADPRAAAPRRALSAAAFLTLVLTALLMAGNLVAARVAFDHGVDVPTAVTIRSLVAAAGLGVLLSVQRVPRVVTNRQCGALILIGTLIAVQSMRLYAAVARMPVALALLVFNSHPLWSAFWARLGYRRPPERALMLAAPVLLVGLALALDVFGAPVIGSSGRHAWGIGVLLASCAAASFALALVLTQQEAGALDGRFRTFCTMAIVGLLAAGATLGYGSGLRLPTAAPGWWGLALMTLLYGVGITLLLTVLPRLGVVGNSAIMNAEPVFALLLAWLILGQTISTSQTLGALIVVAAVMGIGLRRAAQAPRAQARTVAVNASGGR